MTPKDAGLTYPQQAARFIEGLPPDGLPTVVAGDFNASRSRPHRANVQSLAELGLVSAYHKDRHLDRFGDEPDPTSYFRWQESRPYHMDFVFVPDQWVIQSVQVGTFEDYPGHGLSDHVPVVVSVAAQQIGVESLS